MGSNQDDTHRTGHRPKKLVGYYRSPKHAELEHPNIDRSVLMIRSEFEDILGQNEFERAEWVTCQLEKLKHPGVMCMQEHGIGWVMLNKNGVAGYIGGDCAAEYFEAHKAFAGATSRARRDVSLQRVVARLRALLDDAQNERARALRAIARQRSLQERVRRWRDVLPFGVKDRLYHASKTGNRSVRVEFQTEYRVDDEKDKRKYRIVIKWDPDEIGTLMAPRALDPLRLDPIAKGLRSALRALEFGEASVDRKLKEMRGWAEAIEAIDQWEKQLDEHEAELESFEQVENLQLLCWICTGDDQVVCARLALAQTSEKRVSESDARKARNRWYSEIVAAHGDRPFRIM